MSNEPSEPRKVEISMSVATGYESYSELQISSTLFSDNMMVNSDETLISKIILIPPGKHSIYFNCNAPRVNAPLDPRNLVFRVCNFKMKDVDS